MEGKLSFINQDQTEFYTVLKRNVNNYFDQRGITPYANGFMIFKIVFFLLGLVGSYAALVFGGFSVTVSYFLWILLGFFTAFAAVNIGHDAIHGAISPNKTVNTILGYIFNLAGANAYMWNITHNIQHHTFTNIDGYDGDIEAVPSVRLSPHRKRLKINRFQHIYTFIFYGFTSLIWVFYKDYRSFLKTNFGNYVKKKHPTSEFIIMIIFKFIYYALFLIIPLLVMEYLWYQVLLGFFLMHFVEGICLAIIIQLSHLVEKIEFPLPDKNGKMENSWAIHQMKTTADYARNSWMVSFLFGGLNFHIEHHLFQRICHVHHKPLSEIVRKTAAEYNVPYYDFPTLGSALVSHYNFLKKNGRAG